MTALDPRRTEYERRTADHDEARAARSEQIANDREERDMARRDAERDAWLDRRAGL